MLATIDFALALPTLSVVFGSLLGGGGGCCKGDLPPLPSSFLGRVKICLGFGRVEELPCLFEKFKVTVTTVRETRSPDFLIRLTTYKQSYDNELY